MKNLKTFLIVLLGALVLSSCSTDKTMIAKGVNLNNYQYASLTQARNSYGTVTDIEIEPGVYDAIEATRLKMVGERRINDLSSAEKGQLVLAKYSATSTDDESIISVSFEDYMTGKTIASCRASSKGAWVRQRDVDRAISKLRDRIAKVWR
ncbi:MAG: hypothetical protein K6A94_07775 [Bacteroidales bacterium]|nr:hypothetical protein [Bacteroidales bacterium]